MHYEKATFNSSSLIFRIIVLERKKKLNGRGKKTPAYELCLIYTHFLVYILFVVFKGSEFLPLDAQLLVILPINSTLQWFSEEVKKMKFTEIDALL